MGVTVYGIRHHGPGSARSLRAALDDLGPDLVLVEGPPEGDPLVALAASPSMRPPVAVLVYAPGEPQRAAFWPFASFSPEWQALGWAAGRGVPVRFVDLAAAHQLAPGAGDGGGLADQAPPERRDPLAWLAEAAGYPDAERWWEDVVEQRGGPGPFAAIAEAMAALRAESPPPAEWEARREAAMRQGIRRARKDGFGRVAVVCGAWHVPAPADLPPASADAALLRGLPKVKVTATWVPWTHGRLAYASGYGAGVTSPGWYHHLFTTREDVVPRWMARVAGLLRSEGLEVGPADVVDAVRLAEALAALRGRPLAGLDELTDATRAVLARGSDLPLVLVAERLVVGEDLGEVPDDTPMVPLARDLAREQRRLRLRAEASARRLDLDLRRPFDLDRSHLLHRLVLIGVGWAEPEEAEAKAGTFHELWRLQWRPELSLDLVEASMWGTTVAAAAEGRALDRATGAPDLAALTHLVEGCLLADLPAAVAAAVDAFGRRAAVDGDVAHLMDALPALARVLRYGNVRRTDATAVGTVVDGMVPRICIGLPLAASSLDDGAAADLVARVLATHRALATLDRPGLGEAWTGALRTLVDQAGLHPLVAGRVARLLLDGGMLPGGEGARRMAVALSPGEDPGRSAAWVEGFVSGSGLVLLHDDALLGLLDAWVAGVPGERFDEVVPLLRRSFATYPPAERRQLGDLLRRRAGAAIGAAAAPGGGDGLDHERAATVLPVVAALLGLDGDGEGGGG